MKNITLLFSFLLLLVFSACNSGININTGFGTKTVGNGNVVTENRDANENFQKLIASGSVSVFLKQGEEQNIEVEAEDNILPHIITEIKNNELKIKTEGNLSTEIGYTVYVTYVNLNSLKTSGSSFATIESTLSDDVINVITSGSSDVKVKSIESNEVTIISSGASDIEIDNVQSDKITLDTSGASDVKIIGETKEFVGTHSGSSDLHGKNLKTKHAKIHTSGSSDVKISIEESLEAKSSGSSNIYYYGNPSKVEKNSSGSSSITQN